VSKITQLSAQKKNTERINVFVDDKFFCGLAIDDVVKTGLVADMEVDEEFLSNLLSRSGENDMFNRALVYILRSPRTEQEIQRFLSRKKDCSAEMTAKIIERLKTMNYINDEAYAKMFAATKHVKSSARAIKMKLKQKGVKSDLVDAATSDIGKQDVLARAVAEKYMRYREYDQKNLASLHRYLVSKGFEYDAVNEIIEEYKSKREIDPDTREHFKSSYEEYRRAKMQLRDAKCKYKTIKKKVVEELS
jgi:regulatory protein